MLLKAARLAEHPAQQDMLLLSTLTGLSYALPHCVVEHGLPSHTYYPNLMTLVMAPPASGKGVMNLVRKMMKHLQDERRAESVPEIRMGGQVVQEAIERSVFIPGNSSSAAFFKLLKDNDGQGLLFETEMDVVSSTWKHDYANYSYAFRQAYEHETISQARKKSGQGFIEIDHPQLSVLLSGTYNQLLPLIESRENGLASRFMCYTVEDVIPFDERAIHGGEEEANGASAHSDTVQKSKAIIEELDNEIYQLYHFLKDQDHDCNFVLTAEQAEQLRASFHDYYQIAFENVAMPLEFDPMVKRHAVTVMRIGLILSVIRWFEENILIKNLTSDNTSSPTSDSTAVSLPATITPTDADFRVMMTFAETLLIHAGRMMLLLPDTSGATIEVTHTENHEQLLATLPKTFRTAEAVLKGEEMGMCRRTVSRYLDSLVSQKILTKPAKGIYTKI